MLYGQRPASRAFGEFMEGVLAKAREDIEEIYAYGKKFAERGGARFNTSEAMWSYTGKRVGKRERQYKGMKVYCNIDAKAKDPSSEEEMKSRTTINSLCSESGMVR